MVGDPVGDGPGVAGNGPELLAQHLFLRLEVENPALDHQVVALDPGVADDDEIHADVLILPVLEYQIFGFVDPLRRVERAREQLEEGRVFQIVPERFVDDFQILVDGGIQVAALGLELGERQHGRLGRTRLDHDRCVVGLRLGKDHAAQRQQRE